MTRSVLYVRAPTQVFNRGQVAQLEAHLKALEANTTTHPLSTPSELQLDSDGTTLYGHYRYTRVGFAQVTQALAKGLSNLLADVAGLVHRQDQRERRPNTELALRLLRDIVALRFSAISSYRLLRNEQAKLIEGLVGVRQQFLENLSFYHMAEAAVQQHCSQMTLHTAALFGRRLALWYRAERPAFTVTEGETTWPVYLGYYFCNGEATGTSVRGTAAVYCKYGLCLGPYKQYGGRVTHSGRDFNQRLHSMFAHVLTQAPDVSQLRTGFETRMEAQLLPAVTADRDRRLRERRLINGLSQLGVQRNLAHDAVESAVTAGAAPRLPRPVRDREELLEARTQLDLLAALMRIARALDLERREKVEQAAFSVLIGKLM